MTNSLEVIPINELQALLNKKKDEFEKAFEAQQTTPELNSLYQQLKALQIEMNLRKLDNENQFG
jgi:hypothetical protein